MGGGGGGIHHIPHMSKDDSVLMTGLCSKFYYFMIHLYEKKDELLQIISRFSIG